MKRFVYVGVLLAVCGGALSHTYHLGACPIVEPMPGFEMNKVSVFEDIVFSFLLVCLRPLWLVLGCKRLMMMMFTLRPSRIV